MSERNPCLAKSFPASFWIAGDPLPLMPQFQGGRARSGKGLIISLSAPHGPPGPWPTAWLGCDLALGLVLFQKKLAATITIATTIASQDVAYPEPACPGGKTSNERFFRSLAH